jgi:hypothetical protein
MATKVIEFRFEDHYTRWLQENGHRIRIIGFSTRRRLGTRFGFPWADRGYTVTYEELPPAPGPRDPEPPPMLSS